MSSLCRVATCNLNQWSLDFDLNLSQIFRSINEAKKLGARLRIGPELEISGYGCEDHFLEIDTFRHTWESLVALLDSDASDDFLIDVGAPMLHKSCRYNCRVIILNRKIVMIRPKLYLANDGNYRETRWFTAWSQASPSGNDCSTQLDAFRLPPHVARLTGQQTVPFGVAIVECNDTSIACETCEELFTPDSPHIALSLCGAEILTNGSGSHHALRKLQQRLDLMRSATSKCGGAYVYANQQGCDGGRLYYDGSACVVVNGQLVAQASQFCVRDVEVICATVDLDDIRSYRSALASRSVQAGAQRAGGRSVPILHVDYNMTIPRADVPHGLIQLHSDSRRASLRHTHLHKADSAHAHEAVSANAAVHDSSSNSSNHAAATRPPSRAASFDFLDASASPAIQPFLHTAEEEIAYGPACWLWDYLRRSGASGFFLPLSGGADSSATAAMVGSMCHLVCEALGNRDQAVAADVRRIVPRHLFPAHLLSEDAFESISDSALAKLTPADLAHGLFYSCYMGTENSSSETRDRAARIAKQIGAYHVDCRIDAMVSACVTVFATLTGRTPRFRAHGGSATENLALQNIQARLRMVFAYICAQLLPWCRSEPRHNKQTYNSAHKSEAKSPPTRNHPVLPVSSPQAGAQMAQSSYGWLLVLGSANVDEALRGYMTKYDCSSADINPIGGIAKGDLAAFLAFAVKRFNYTELESVLHATPTAELEPMSESYTQSDESDMGCTYVELGVFGRLRKLYRCGPVSMYEKLRTLWSAERGLSPSQVAAKVRHFFYYYAVNRHKLTTLTPSYHAENYSPDDHRFDLRPFLYNTKWKRQFEDIQHLVKVDEQAIEKRDKDTDATQSRL